jgi:hypothetical protein
LEVSRLGTVSRYVGQVEESGSGRWTPAAAHAIDTARDPVRLPQAEARAWLETATLAVRACARTGQSDSDLLATIGRVVGRDARLVARAAYPGDPRAQERALDVLRAEHRPLAKYSLGRRIEREVRRRREAGAGESDDEPHRGGPVGRGSR